MWAVRAAGGRWNRIQIKPSASLSALSLILWFAALMMPESVYRLGLMFGSQAPRQTGKHSHQPRLPVGPQWCECAPDETSAAAQQPAVFSTRTELPVSFSDFLPIFSWKRRQLQSKQPFDKKKRFPEIKMISQLPQSRTAFLELKIFHHLINIDFHALRWLI